MTISEKATNLATNLYNYCQQTYESSEFKDQVQLTKIKEAALNYLNPFTSPIKQYAFGTAVISKFIFSEMAYSTALFIGQATYIGLLVYQSKSNPQTTAQLSNKVVITATVASTIASAILGLSFIKSFIVGGFTYISSFSSLNNPKQTSMASSSEESDRKIQSPNFPMQPNTSGQEISETAKND
ncbi:MAG: hypothetical protein WCT85_07020 [Parachlamydiales bacterium]|jgi:hypothetical protein